MAGLPDSLLRPEQTRRLLDELCVRLGFCLPQADKQRLINDPPRDAKAFADEVFRAEGMDPDASGFNLHLGRQVRDTVQKHVDLAVELNEQDLMKQPRSEGRE